MNVVPDGWAMPALTPLNEAWFTSGQIAIQRCERCATLQHPPEEICHICGSMDLGSVTLRPTGTVYSYTIVHHPANPALLESVPYAVVLVSLDDAPHIRVVGNLPGLSPRIGMPVIAVWETRTAEDGTQVLIPQWRPA